MRTRDDSTYTIAAEMMDFRTLGVIYEEPEKKFSFYCELSAETKGLWIADADLNYWNTGEAVLESERQLVLDRLNEWGKPRGWQFKKGVKILDARLKDVAPEERENLRKLQELARESIEARERAYRELS